MPMVADRAVVGAWHRRSLAVRLEHRLEARLQFDAPLGVQHGLTTGIRVDLALLGVGSAIHHFSQAPLGCGEFTSGRHVGPPVVFETYYCAASPQGSRRSV